MQLDLDWIVARGGRECRFPLPHRAGQRGCRRRWLAVERTLLAFLHVIMRQEGAKVVLTWLFSLLLASFSEEAYHGLSFTPHPTLTQHSATPSCRTTSVQQPCRPPAVCPPSGYTVALGVVGSR